MYLLKYLYLRIFYLFGTLEASQIDAYGEEHLYGGAVDSLQKVCA
jgi:hypothetical protein